MKEFEISAENEGQRFDKYLSRILKDGSMSFIYKMLRKKNFVLNDKKADGKEILKAGDKVKLYIADETFDKFKTKTNTIILQSKSLDNCTKNNIKNINLTKNNICSISNKIDISKLLIYEDKDIILVNKPTGILSQKSKNDDISINELIINYLLNENKLSENQLINYKPSVINRLDRNTSGIIIVSKNLKSAQVLSKGLKDRTINKYYKCSVYGIFSKSGKYSAYLTKNKSDNIVRITDSPVDKTSDYIETEYELLSEDNSNNVPISEVKVHLITGKSHQIRAHISFLGFPIIGDPKYGNIALNKKLKVSTQKLHAFRIEFPNYPEEYDFAFSGKAFECNK